MHWAKQSTAVSYVVGPILDSAGAEYTGAVIGDLSLSKNGGTLTALASAATLTHVANGQYTLALTTGNTDTLGTARILCNKSTYQMPTLELMVLPATVYDALTTNATTAAGGLGDIQRMAGTALTARDIGASVLLSSGTGTGQVKLSGGYVAPNWGDVGNPTTAVNLSGTSTKAVEPTVAGRTLDVSAQGNAGIDWANIDNNTTTVNLSGTTVGAVTAATVASVAANAVNAAALSSDAVAEIKAAIVTNTLTVDAGGVASANATQWAGQPVLWNVEGVPVVDVGYWQGLVPDNLNGGLVRADVFAVEAGAIGTASFAAGATVPRVTLCDTLTTYTNNTPQTGDAFARIGATGSGLTTLATAAGVAALPTADQNADALLGRNVAGGSSTGRLVKEALYALRNKVAIVGTTMQVMSTDDVTVAWTATLTAAAGADPISAIDPTA